MTEASNISSAELLPVELNGKNYNFKYEPRCRVCTAGPEITSLVNRMLTQGVTYMQIFHKMQTLEEPPPAEITYNSIRTHSQRHLPERAAAIRTIVEERSAQRSIDFVEGTTNLITPQILAEVMVKRGFENIVADSTVVTPVEALAAAKVMSEFAKDEQGQMDVVQAFAQLNRIINAVKQVCPPEMWKEIVLHIQSEAPTALTGAIAPSSSESSSLPPRFDPPHVSDERDTF